MQKKPKEITKRMIVEKYGIPASMIGRYLPPPRKVKNQNYASAKPILLWNEADVQRAVQKHPEIARLKNKKTEQKKKDERKAQDAIRFLEQFSPENLFEAGKELKRKFTLHIGPTNSGKTYQALQALKQAETGVYLGPLRLLALEVAENMNADGCPCSLLTGEEYIDVPDARKTASTIELLNYDEHYDVAVIDEAQMLEDPFRGPHWVRAISLVDADEVHICMSPEALDILGMIMEKMEAPYEIAFHERLVPLKYRGLFRDITEVEKGDALIAFSRKRVLQIAAELESKGIRASVIYGALPPASRREEVRRFSDGETSCVVATDAIGMGISLPIRRVIFTESEKFDGKKSRSLNRTEIKQIAGRAGRFGKYDLGEVLTMSDPRRISNALKLSAKQIEKLTIAFPQEALDYDSPLKDMLEYWNALPKNDLFLREDMSDALKLLNSLGHIPKDTDKALLYTLISCPVDVKNPSLVQYWASACSRILRNENIFRPYFPESTLEECELKYRAYDIYHQLLRRIGIEDDCLEEKEKLSAKINEFLKQEKSDFLKRCRICGREMSMNSRFSICDVCYKRHYNFEDDDDEAVVN